MRKLSVDELNRLTVSEFRNKPKIPVSVILNNVRSMNNIGSVFRTCDAFLIKKLYLCGITACPPHKDKHKTALGATESVSWEYHENTAELVRKLKDENCLVAAAEQTDKSLFLPDLMVDYNKEYVIIFGHEINGIDQEVVNLADFSVEIPQYGTKHSLNISVSAGIILWEFARQLIK